MDFNHLVTLSVNEPGRLIWNLLDIAIVSYIIYRILLLIRDTRAEQLIKGLLVLLGLSIGSRYLGMDALRWLMEKTWTALFIALPVVFQPELRRALEQLGRGSFFATTRMAEEEEIENAVRETAMACARLSEERTGALIVWERETGLDEYMETGVRMEAAVSCPLLMNIFVPNTPLHDGAVIIRRGRLMRAACVLPLTDNRELDRRLGTRHRAAIGISEVSDAVVVVVSEETGSISLAEAGGLIRNLSEDDLRAALMDRLVEPRHRRWPFIIEH